MLLFFGLTHPNFWMVVYIFLLETRCVLQRTLQAEWCLAISLYYLFIFQHVLHLFLILFSGWTFSFFPPFPNTSSHPLRHSVRTPHPSHSPHPVVSLFTSASFHWFDSWPQCCFPVHTKTFTQHTPLPPLDVHWHAHASKPRIHLCVTLWTRIQTSNSVSLRWFFFRE